MEMRLIRKISKKSDASDFGKVEDFLEEFGNHISAAVKALRNANTEMKMDKSLSAEDAKKFNNLLTMAKSDIDVLNKHYEALKRQFVTK